MNPGYAVAVWRFGGGVMLITALMWACSGGTPSGSSDGGAAAVGGAATTSGSGGETIPVDPKVNGQSCATDEQCQSGFCVTDDGGICCDAACDGTCVSCSFDKTEQPNGECAPIVAHTDPDAECQAPSTCDGVDGCCGKLPEPPGGDCPDVCTGGCDAGTCRIVCDMEDACRDATIDCPPGFACHVTCAGNHGCEKAELNCPATYACEVTCADINHACRDLDMNCTDGTCTMTCNGQDEDSCDRATVECGAGSCTATCLSNDSGDDIDVNCNDSCSCERSSCP